MTIELYKQAQNALVTGNYKECKRIMAERFDYVVVSGHSVFMLQEWDIVQDIDVFHVCSNDAEARKLFTV